MKNTIEQTVIFMFAGFWFLFGIALSFSRCADLPEKQATESVPVARESVPETHFCATIGRIERPVQAVGVRGQFWKNGQDIKIKFLGGTEAQKQYVLTALAQWSEIVNLKFLIMASGKTDWRISFTNSGSWSYVGIDCSSIPSNQATMNIGWPGVDVCLHEIGHALGMAHEQANPNGGICWNKPVVYAALAAPPNNWSKSMVDSNVFYKYDTTKVFTTPFDGVSIMQYSIPDTWVCDRKGFPGGKTLSATDRVFMAGIYPKTVVPPVVTGKTLTAEQVARLNAISDEIKAMVK